MAKALAHPHDHLFRSVFSRPAEAAALLRPRLEEDIREAVDWSTLTRVGGALVDENLRRSEPDLVFRVEPAGDPRPPRLYRQQYILLEHQSSPDSSMPLRMMRHCLQICEDALEKAPVTRLPKVLAVVFYLGRQKWTHSSLAEDFFPEAAGTWPKSPFAYRVLDETRRPPDQVEAGPWGSVALPVLRAGAYPKTRKAELKRAADLAGELYKRLHKRVRKRALRRFMTYLVVTIDPTDVWLFRRRAQRYAPWLGGNMVTLAEHWMAEGLAQAVEGFLKAGVSWEVIEKATGLDEAGFRALQEQIASIQEQLASNS